MKSLIVQLKHILGGYFKKEIGSLKNVLTENSKYDLIKDFQMLFKKKGKAKILRY